MRSKRHQPEALSPDVLQLFCSLCSVNFPFLDFQLPVFARRDGFVAVGFNYSHNKPKKVTKGTKKILEEKIGWRADLDIEKAEGSQYQIFPG